VKRDRDLDQPLERRPDGLRRAKPHRLEQLVHLEEEAVVRKRGRSVEKRRLVKRLGAAGRATMAHVDRALRVSVGLD